jgi:hypothetical protein
VPRPVAQRVSYRSDASYLLRLEDALSKDKRQSPAWRVGSTRLARKLALRLLEADAKKNMGTEADVNKQATVVKKRPGRREPGAGTAEQ